MFISIRFRFSKTEESKIIQKGIRDGRIFTRVVTRVEITGSDSSNTVRFKGCHITRDDTNSIMTLDSHFENQEELSKIIVAGKMWFRTGKSMSGLMTLD